MRVNEYNRFLGKNVTVSYTPKSSLISGDTVTGILELGPLVDGNKTYKIGTIVVEVDRILSIS